MTIGFIVIMTLFMAIVTMRAVAGFFRSLILVKE